MKQVDIIIVGQGIAGTNLAFFAEKSGLSFVVYDENHHESSSMVAAGLINPLTGRKYVKSWMMDDILPFAKATYKEIGDQLGIKAFTQRKIFRALYGPKEENLFLSKSNDDNTAHYIDTQADDSQYDGKVKGVLSYGCVTGGGQVHLQEIIVAYRQYLNENSLLKNDRFDYEKLEKTATGFQYQDYESKYIIFAEGHQASKNPYFTNVNHDPAKGEVLIVKIESAKFVDILRHKMFVIPMGNDLYWVGAGYIWDFEDDKPSMKERQRLEEQLASILDCDYEVVDHKAAIRPCVKERRPRLAEHSDHKGMYLFSGMGTKGSSLAPYWANHLIDVIHNEKEISDEVRLK